MDDLKITLKTLTPLWTGGVEGTCDRLHETGLIGSLRWWYEALVRGLGGYACDPTEHSCKFDEDEYRKSQADNERQRLRDAGVCDACQLFGCTGWRRRFRLKVVKDDTVSLWTPEERMLNIRPPDRNRGWFLPPGRMGTLTLRLDGDESTLKLLAALLLFVERWGNIGAKPQSGYGLFSLTNREELDKRVEAWRWDTLGDRAPHDKCPDLRRFGFFRYRFTPEKPGWWPQVPGMRRVASQVQSLVHQWQMMPLAPTLKNAWRFHHWQGTPDAAREIFGSLHPERVRSKVAVSWAYRQGEHWEVRGWVWLHLPRTDDEVWRILSAPTIWETELNVPGALATWPRGTWKPWAIADIQQFLEAAA